MSNDTILRLTAFLEVMFVTSFYAISIPFLSAGIGWLWKHRRF